MLRLGTIQRIKFMQVLCRLISHYSNYYLHSTGVRQRNIHFLKAFLRRSFLQVITVWRTPSNYSTVCFQWCNCVNIIIIMRKGVFLFVPTRKRSRYFSPHSVTALSFREVFETYNIVLAIFLGYILTFLWALIPRTLDSRLGGTRPWCRFYFTA